jgi:SAM-dependent methyltransferase
VSASDRSKPPLAVRLAGQAISLVVARAPALWPVLRGPTRRFWERSAGGWDERANPDSAEHLASLAAACDRLPAPPDRILELGTGTGAGARMLAQRFPTATIDAVDLSPTMVEAARAKTTAPVRFTVADAGSLPFDDDSFDLVVQLNMPVYPGEVTRVLGPRGHVVVASSLGPATPYYTPERLLARRFAKLGFERPLTGEVDDATYFMAQRGAP